MSNYAPDYQRAPKLGENNEEILKSLGYTDEQIADLATKGRHRLERWRQGRPHRRSGTGLIALL